MRGQNINVYFTSDNLKQLQELIKERKFSNFVNQAVEEKLAKQKKEDKAKLVAGYQARNKNQNLKETLQTYGKMSLEDISKSLEKDE